MKRITLLMTGLFTIAMALPFSAANSEGNKLDIDGKVLTTKVAAPKGHALDKIMSGWEFRKKSTQDLQKDDFQNPGFIWVEIGKELWSKVDGKAGKSCASCHKDAETSMKGVGAAMPKWDKKTKKPINLEMQINKCRTERLQAKKWKGKSQELLSMTTYVRYQSRGMPVKVKTDGDIKPWYDKGKKIFYTRTGQLDLSCSNCHEDYYGKYIRADRLSQGQINGFPVYRLKWQGMGSVHRRFKGCMKQVRAKPYKVGSDEFLALEVYVAARGNGLSVETPSVRN